MPIQQRTRGKLPSPGPYLAEITNHLDTSYMGSLEVALIKGLPGNVSNQEETYIVKYLSPFYGVTSIRYEGNNSGDFNDVQKSYGMWMIPPDVGTTVMVIFIEGDPNQGYWMGCVQDQFQNHMVPGIAASKMVEMTPEQRKKYGVDLLPVAEFNKTTQRLQIPDPGKIAKPVHPFADRLLAQGLLADTVRGVTSSSARRDLPSSVFGISTPGPLDPSGKKGYVGYSRVQQTPVSRLGGSTFVMDDGDVDGQNELVRIRTRTGHQVLLHNSSDLIYIANSKGTAWIELTSNGKIDIYAADSVSIHSENDFNFRADRDVNIEAGRNFNIASNGTTNINSNGTYNLIAQDGLISFKGSYDHTVGTSAKFTVNSDYHLKASNVFETASSNFNLKGATNNFTSSADTNISAGGNVIVTGGKIHLNGPAAAQATDATSASTPAPLRVFSLPNRSASAEWADGNFFNAGSIASIMQRVPTHEPWDQHENVNPTQFNSFNTDALAGSSGSPSSANTPWPQPNSAVPADWSKDIEFINKVKDVSNTLGCDYVDLLCCMQFESNMNPAARNPKSTATGLIQFMDFTAKNLGTTIQALAGMTRVDQMDYVLKYFQKTNLPKVKNPTLADVYMGILAPAYVGTPGNTPVYTATRDGNSYWANSTLDTNKDNAITKDEAAAFPASRLAYVKQQLVNAGFTS
jgi:Transglycosylase SLT domain/Type VI secretion system/phage-baseplate injector OB domain